MRISLKGQSAIEYLMTYGWMLLVVAVAGGAIFSTVQGESIDSTTFTGGDIVIENFGVTSNDMLQVQLRNAQSEKLDIDYINITDGETSFIQSVDQSISVGDSNVLELPGITRGNEATSLEVVINYAYGGLTNLNSQGSISGDLELQNFTIIDAYTSLNPPYTDLEDDGNGCWSFRSDNSYVGTSLTYSGCATARVALSQEGEGLNYYPEKGDKFDMHIMIEDLEGNHGGTVFGAENIDNHYLMRWNDGFQLIKRNGGFNTLDSDEADIEEGEWYRIEVNWAEDDTITGKLFSTETDQEIARVEAQDDTYSMENGFGMRGRNSGGTVNYDLARYLGPAE